MVKGEVGKKPLTPREWGPLDGAQAGLGHRDLLHAQGSDPAGASPFFELFLVGRGGRLGCGMLPYHTSVLKPQGPIWEAPTFQEWVALCRASEELAGGLLISVVCPWRLFLNSFQGRQLITLPACLPLPPSFPLSLSPKQRGLAQDGRALDPGGICPDSCRACILRPCP